MYSPKEKAAVAGTILVLFFQNEPEQVKFVQEKYQNTSFSPVWKPEKVLSIEYE